MPRKFLPAMKRKGIGTVVNITSVASRIVWPGAAAYTAVRWAMAGFTESLRAELYWTDINVALAMFGSVRSPYWEHNPGSLERLPRIARMARMITAETAAEAIVRAVEKNKRLGLRPHIFRFIFLLNSLFPSSMERMMCQTGWKSE